MASRTRTFLAIPLLGRAIDFAAGFGFVRARAALGELPYDHPLNKIGARLQSENVVLELDFAGGLRVQSENFLFHGQLPAFSSAFGFSAFLIDPGIGKSLAGRLTASRTMTQPPLEPGTAPLIMMRPRSTSIFATSRFCVVMRSTP